MVEVMKMLCAALGGRSSAPEVPITLLPKVPKALPAPAPALPQGHDGLSLALAASSAESPRVDEMDSDEDDYKESGHLFALPAPPAPTPSKATVERSVAETTRLIAESTAKRSKFVVATMKKPAAAKPDKKDTPEKQDKPDKVGKDMSDKKGKPGKKDKARQERHARQEGQRWQARFARNRMVARTRSGSRRAFWIVLTTYGFKPHRGSPACWCVRDAATSSLGGQRRRRCVCVQDDKREGVAELCGGSGGGGL